MWRRFRTGIDIPVKIGNDGFGVFPFVKLLQIVRTHDEGEFLLRILVGEAF